MPQALSLLLSYARWLSAASASAPPERLFALVVSCQSDRTAVHTFHFGLPSLRSRAAEPLLLLNHAVEEQRPGLGALAGDASGAAASLLDLLRRAEAGVPALLRASAPLAIHLTAELGAELGEARAEEVQEALRSLLLESVPAFRSAAVAPLPAQRRAQLTWLAVNFLAGRLHRGGRAARTRGVIELDAQDAGRAHALDGAIRPGRPDVAPIGGAGQTWQLFSRGWEGQGGMAGRTRLLRPSGGPASSSAASHGAQAGAHPCLAEAVVMSYGNVTWVGGVGEEEGGEAVDDRCAAAVQRGFLRTSCPPYPAAECAFGGVWGGGRGGGTAALVGTGLLFDRALQAGLVPSGALSAPVAPAAFRTAAASACGLPGSALHKLFKRAPAGGADLAMFCFDLVYTHKLLVEGLGVAEEQPMLLVKRMLYRQRLVDASWPLGAAVEGIAHERRLS